MWINFIGVQRFLGFACGDKLGIETGEVLKISMK